MSLRHEGEGRAWHVLQSGAKVVVDEDRVGLGLVFLLEKPVHDPEPFFESKTITGRNRPGSLIASEKKNSELRRSSSGSGILRGRLRRDCERFDNRKEKGLPCV